MNNTHDESPRSTELRNEGSLVETPATPPPTLRIRQREYLHAATAEHTRRAYRAAIRHFERWGGRLPTTRETLMP